VELTAEPSPEHPIRSLQHKEIHLVNRTVERLALFGALLTTFEALHPLCDQWVQGSATAATKRLYGNHLVYGDGTPADTEERPGQPVMTANQLGRRSVAKHVSSYLAVQTAGAIAITRAFGYRVPLSAWVAGAVINGITHAAIDRGALLEWLAQHTGKDGYIQHCQALRLTEEGEVVQQRTGPGSAWMELDAALHEAIGTVAAGFTTWLATRRCTRRR
jgi:hypothetical protein